MVFEALYQLGIWFLSCVMKVGALFNTKIRKGVNGRNGLIERLEVDFPALAGGRPVAWVHAASLGEFEQGRPVIEAFKSALPDFFLVVTFFSPSGYEVRKNYQGADYICYLPLDSKDNARRFVRILNPEIVFFVKYEFWFNYLNELRKRNTSVISFSTIFRPEQVFFKFYGGFYRKLLTYFDCILVQNQQSLALLNSIGIYSCTIAGDTRFDRVKAIASAARELPEIASFVDEAFCLVAGSVWQADMDVLIPALNKAPRGIKAIIAPHEIKAEQIKSWRSMLTARSILYSDYITGKQVEPFDYLIIDNIGMLSSLYRYGDVAFIGGAFETGLHNILEAATFGLPVLFGNNKYHKFQEAIDLIGAGGAVAVSDLKETTSILEKLLTDRNLREEMGRVNAEYVLSQTGATEKVIMEAKSLLAIKK